MTSKKSSRAPAKSALPESLKTLISETVTLLGQTVEAEEGKKVFQVIEKTRLKMTKLRTASYANEKKVLSDLLNEFRKLSREERCATARAFSLMMELTNICENAYRSHRLKNEHDHPPIIHKMKRAVFVLTAHPTEARPTLMIHYVDELQNLLIDCLERGRSADRSDIRHIIRLLWRLPLAKHERPTPQDEAEHIFSLLFSEQIFEKILLFERNEGLNIFYRTWVGGDKDGHPGVDAKVLRDCLQASRSHLIAAVLVDLQNLGIDLAVYVNDAPKEQEPVAQISELRDSLEHKANHLGKIEDHDGKLVLEFWEGLKALSDAYRNWIGEPHPSLNRLESMKRCFPGLVMPIELRESADAVAKPEGAGRAIKGMLKELAKIAGPAPVISYARALVLSMAETKKDILAGVSLCDDCLGNASFPVIPLFEQRSALEGAPKVLQSLLADPTFRKRVKDHWSDHLELMLGYSDSAKESGSLPSRLLIQTSVAAIDRAIRKAGVRPIFFHGSGGSVARGGGSIEDQTAWWPKSAREVFKVTIQGEMIQRSLASPEILDSQLRKIAEASNKKPCAARPKELTASLTQLAEGIRSHYQATLSDDSFLEVVEEATAYRYLNELKLGSRPSKRKASGDLKISDLRAIPWVLSWTQTRVLFPTWWGVGSSFESLKKSDQARLKRTYKLDPMFRSYVHLFGFTLAKVELAAWTLYLKESALSEAIQKATETMFIEELKRAKSFFEAVTGKKDLLFFRPWLRDSIYLRTKMIHPLNALQVLALEDEHDTLLRMTVSGIASGMLTTG